MFRLHKEICEGTNHARFPNSLLKNPFFSAAGAGFPALVPAMLAPQLWQYLVPAGLLVPHLGQFTKSSNLGSCPVGSLGASAMAMYLLRGERQLPLLAQHWPRCSGHAEA